MRIRAPSSHGYPTGSGRSEQTQKEGLETMVGTVAEYRANYNVTDYRWFDLRDGDTGSPNFQQHYGLMTDDYKPKPAYASWKRLIGKLTVKSPEPGPGREPQPQPGPQPGTAPTPDATTRPSLRLVVRCYRRGVRAWVRGAGVGRVRNVTFTARGTRV